MVDQPPPEHPGWVITDGTCLRRCSRSSNRSETVGRTGGAPATDAHTLSTDLTVLFLVLPTVSADLAATASQGLWIVHAYGVLIAAFLVSMGRLGDRIGPRWL